MKTIIHFLILTILFSQMAISQEIIYSTDSLQIEKIDNDLYRHISYLDLSNGEKFPSNGMIYFNENEAVVFDTPTNDLASKDLIHWIQNEQKKKIKAVVIGHFHTDCLGGLKEFHRQNIRSYASDLSIQLARENNIETLPETGFKEELVLKLGNGETITRFFGEGHTWDNVVSYIPAKNAVFGGCLIKEMGAGKGNLKDANVKEWSATVRSIQQEYPDLKLIIPGHGKTGDKEILDYTIHLFEQ
jgi:metallo-beta-lactamase class B